MDEKQDNKVDLSREVIQSKIYTIRGQQVMLDRDLAELYGVETRVLKQSVNRNIDRFPEDEFLIRLSKIEYELLRSQSVTLEKGRGRHSKYLPYAFTEYGVFQVSTILKSKRALNVNIQIMRSFVKMRQFLVQNQELEMKVSEIEQFIANQKDKNTEIFTALKYLLEDDKTSYLNKGGV